MKLSIVAVTRNDNHGGDLDLRMQLFLDSLFEQCKRRCFLIELILVEWNPPPDRLRLSQSLNWEKQSEFSPVRIIEIPGYIHSAYNYADKLPLYQMIGKNAGIRRAKGDFILSTNVDIIFSDELFEYLITEDFEKGRIYRADRFDIKSSVPEIISYDDLQAFCKSNVVRKNKRYVIESLITSQTFPIYENDVIEFCQDNNLDCLIHTNACGDFQLLSRHDWEKLHAYPEFDMYSMHIDSVFAYMALMNGIKEICVSDTDERRVMYHIEHQSGYRPEDSEEIDVRFKRRGIYCLNYQQLVGIAINMADNRIEKVINNSDWGFGRSLLKETLVETGRDFVVSVESPASDSIHRVCDTENWIKRIEKMEDEVSGLDESNLFVEWLKKTWFEILLIRGETEAFDSFFKRLENKLEFIVFGASTAFKRNFLPVMKHFNLAAKYIVDNDAEKIGGHLESIIICDTKKLLNENKEDIFILITSMFYDEIKNQLTDMGFLEYWNFIGIGNPVMLNMMDFSIKYNNRKKEEI